ncbi:hypothetical protein CKAH01_05403 [Colletotrichum kahawae]|uniref:Uncharacterized protein n=1 Tax=Colletotrichum kahawae TaxID=34407 RepID=A0AAE0D560_COLKA|nr:hypothetical protein CKAH01_05403 [Colletotrichum kahawae]
MMTVEAHGTLRAAREEARRKELPRVADDDLGKSRPNSSRCRVLEFTAASRRIVARAAKSWLRLTGNITYFKSGTPAGAVESAPGTLRPGEGFDCVERDLIGSWPRVAGSSIRHRPGETTTRRNPDGWIMGAIASESDSDTGVHPSRRLVLCCVAMRCALCVVR